MVLGVTIRPVTTPSMAGSDQLGCIERLTALPGVDTGAPGL
jgi:hypothetical protein